MSELGFLCSPDLETRATQLFLVLHSTLLLICTAGVAASAASAWCSAGITDSCRCIPLLSRGTLHHRLRPGHHRCRASHSCSHFATGSGVSSHSKWQRAVGSSLGESKLLATVTVLLLCALSLALCLLMLFCCRLLVFLVESCFLQANVHGLGRGKHLTVCHLVLRAVGLLGNITLVSLYSSHQRLKYLYHIWSHHGLQYSCVCSGQQTRAACACLKLLSKPVPTRLGLFIFVFLCLSVPASHASVILWQPCRPVWTAGIDMFCTGCTSSCSARCMHVTDEDPLFSLVHLHYHLSHA